MNCRDCGEPIQFLEGDRRPYDLTPRVHYANPKHIAAKKNGPGIARSAKKVKLTEAETMLCEMGYPRLLSADLLRDIPEGEPTEMVLAALKKKGA